MNARRLTLLAPAALGALAGGLSLWSTSAMAGGGTCPNEAVRAGLSASLPDCRAYEMVTPVDKANSAQDLTHENGSPFQVVPAEDGERFALHSPGTLSVDPNPTPIGSSVMFSRTASGWQTSSLTPPGAGGTIYSSGTGDVLFSPDLSQVALKSYDILFPVGPNETLQLGPGGGPYTPLVATPVQNGNKASAADWLGGASTDLSHIFFESTDRALVPGSPTSTVPNAHDLYEWNEGRMSVVDLANSGSQVVSPCGVEFKSASPDGSRVIFESRDESIYFSSVPCQEETKQLYMRVNGSSTVDVSAGFTYGILFEGASADGSKVFFTAPTEGNFENEQLWEYDLSAPEGERLTHISSGAGDNVERSHVSVSGDGSRVYWRTAGTDLIYRYNTITHELHFITGAAGPSYGPEQQYLQQTPNDGESTQVTPDGKTFLFVSYTPVVPMNNPHGYDEVFRYDDEDGSITCVSCPPNGAPARGGASLPDGTNQLTTADRTPSVKSMSNNGQYVFFDSNDALVPQDVNGTGGNAGSEQEPWTDVYEWHNGVVSLISSGTDPHAAILLGASADGSNVFFLTHSQLVPQDTDNSGDIYDARIGGGFPTATESAACQGDTCVHQPPAPIDPALSSSSFSGPGNPTPVLTSESGTKPKPQQCRKGTVRKKGRCVKRRHTKKAKRATRPAAIHGQGGVR